jgi:DNA-binding MarR family transcriptional regulator
MSTPNETTDWQAETGVRATDPVGRSKPTGMAPSTEMAAWGASVDSLASATAAFRGAFERWANHKAIEAGLSAPRLRLLNFVHCHGPQKMADLADALAVTPRNVTALVDGLEADGLLRRLPHSTDRRVTLVELSCNSDLVASKFRAFQDSLGGLFISLDEEERRTLLRLLTTLHDRIDAEAGAPNVAPNETMVASDA